MPGVVQITLYSNAGNSQFSSHHHHHHHHDEYYHSASEDSSSLSLESNSNHTSSFYGHGCSSPVRSSSSSSLPICWSFPALLLSESTIGHYRPDLMLESLDHSSSYSSSSQQSRPRKYHPLLIHSRVASALGIHEGDYITFSLCDYTHTHNHNHNNSHHHHGYDYRHAETWARANMDLFSLKASIIIASQQQQQQQQPCSFDVAIDTTNRKARHIFDGTLHNPLGNFVMLTNGSLLKLSEQERVYRPHKTCQDLTCAGMLLQVEGITDYYNSQQDGAACGFAIYASTPLSSQLRWSDQLVHGYRYLGHTTKVDEAIYWGLLEALVWVFRLDFQTVWIVGSNAHVFRQVLMENHKDDPPVSHINSSSRNSVNNSNNNNNKSTVSCSSNESLDQSTTTTSTTTVVQSLKHQVQSMLHRARQRRIQFKFLTSKDTGVATDLATRALVQRRNETWCHWSTINYQCQRNLPFHPTLARQVSI